MGCSSDSLRYHRKHSATGVLPHLSRDRGISVGSLSPRILGVWRENPCFFGDIPCFAPKSKEKKASVLLDVSDAFYAWVGRGTGGGVEGS